VGAIGRTFAPTANGNYALAIEQNGCIDTSACFLFTGIGIQQVSTPSAIKVYPNPNTGHFYIDLSAVEEATLSIYSADGKRVAFHPNLNAAQHLIPLQAATGVYILEVKTAKNTRHYQLIKQ
jgi:hypothetical protein